MMGTGVGGRPVLLFGPRGMGKTALLEEFENDPPHDADVRCITPGTGLIDINSIPGILLSKTEAWRGWRKWLKKAAKNTPGKASIELPLVGALGYEFKGDMNEAACSERIKIEIIRECAMRPKVLVVDEAHMLTKNTGAFFLNYAQSIIKNGAKLQLVLAGTSNLRSALLRTGASFIGRGRSLAVGPLDVDAAHDSIRVPLGDRKVSIDEGVLAEVVENSQRYPYFLQIWGEELWAARKKHAMGEIGWAVYGDAKDAVEERKANHYRGYFDELSNPAHLLAAKALADAFIAIKDRNDSHEDAGMRSAEALTVVASLTDASLGGLKRIEMAQEVMEIMKAKDVLWEPEDGVAKAALPSFHLFIQSKANEIIDTLRRGGISGFGEDQDQGVDGPAVPMPVRSGLPGGDAPRGGSRARGRGGSSGRGRGR